MRLNKSPTETALSRAVLRWHLTRPTQVADTETSHIFRVEREGAGPAALKLIRPGMREALRGALAQAWYAGVGAAEVYDANSEAVLMEWLEGPELARLVADGEDERATEILAEVVAGLHTQRGEAPRGLMPLVERFEALTGGDRQLWPAAGRDLFARAAGIAMALTDAPVRPIPLHGDLHHFNVLKSARGWLAIDPKGLIGDPAYELAPAFLSPVSDRRLCTDPRRIARLVKLFSARLEIEAGRIVKYGIVHAALSACWSLQAGEEPRHAIAVLERLLAFATEGS